MRITNTISKSSKSQKIMGAIALALGLALVSPMLGSTASASVDDGHYCIQATGNGHAGKHGACDAAPVVVAPPTPDLSDAVLKLSYSGSFGALPRDGAGIYVVQNPSGTVSQIDGGVYNKADGPGFIRGLEAATESVKVEARIGGKTIAATDPVMVKSLVKNPETGVYENTNPAELKTTPVNVVVRGTISADRKPSTTGSTPTSEPYTYKVVDSTGKTVAEGNAMSDGITGNRIAIEATYTLSGDQVASITVPLNGSVSPMIPKWTVTFGYKGQSYTSVVTDVNVNTNWNTVDSLTFYAPRLDLSSHLYVGGNGKAGTTPAAIR